VELLYEVGNKQS